MMNGDETYEFKQKISNGFADSILASSPTKNGTMNANSLGDGCDLEDREHDRLMHDISMKEKSGFSQSGSPSPSPESCSPCPNGDEQDQSDQYHKENNHHVKLDGVWPNGPAAVQQFTNQGGRKEGDSGFISPEGASNGAGVMEGRSLMDGASFHSNLQRQSSDGLMEFEVNRTPSLDVEIDSKPLDLSLDSDVDGLASSVHDKDEDCNEDFEILSETKATENSFSMNDIDMKIEGQAFPENVKPKSDEDVLNNTTINNFHLTEDDGLGLEQEEIIGNELTKTKLELKESTDTEKDADSDKEDYDYELKQDDGCSSYDPMTTSMIQPSDPMTTSMINFSMEENTEKDSIFEDHNTNHIQSKEINKEEQLLSSEDEEDHTEKKDAEKDHSSSSSSDEDEEGDKKDELMKNISRSSSFSDNIAELKEKEDLQLLIQEKGSDDEESEKKSLTTKEIDQTIKRDRHVSESSSSEEGEEIDDSDKDIGSEKDSISYKAMPTEKEEDKEESEQKVGHEASIMENIVFTESEKVSLEVDDIDTTDIHKEQTAECNFIKDETEEILSIEKKNTEEVDSEPSSPLEDKDCFANTEVSPFETKQTDSALDTQESTTENYTTEMDKSPLLELNQDNVSSCLGDVRSIQEMHNEDINKKLENTIDDEDDSKDGPVSPVDSQSGSRKNSLSSAFPAEEKEILDETKIAECETSEIKSEDICFDDYANRTEHENVSKEVQQEESTSLENLGRKENELFSQNADLSKEEDATVCFNSLSDALTQNDIVGDIKLSNNDNDETEDFLMKESMVTNVSEGKPSDFGFELNENIDHDTRGDSLAAFEPTEIVDESSMDTLLKQTSSEIQTNEFSYQTNEETSLELSSIDSQAQAGQFSCREIAENAAVSLVDENLMDDNMSNIKETETSVETNTNLAGSPEPSGIFSQNDEHMVHEVSDFGVKEDCENLNEENKAENPLADDSLITSSKDELKTNDNENISVTAKEHKEIYENTAFELDSVTKDSVFDQDKISVETKVECIAPVEDRFSQELEKEVFAVDADTGAKDLVPEQEQNMDKQNESVVTEKDSACSTADIKVDSHIDKTPEMESQLLKEEEKVVDEIENNVQSADEANIPNEPIFEEKREEQDSLNVGEVSIQSVSEVLVEASKDDKSEKLTDEREIDTLQKQDFKEESRSDIQENEQIELEKSSVQDFEHQEIQNEMVAVNQSESLSVSGSIADVKDSQPVEDIEAVKEALVETHLTSQELNANLVEQNTETTSDVKQGSMEIGKEPVPIVLPVDEPKKDEVPESKAKVPATKKATSKPAAKSAGTVSNKTAGKPNTTSPAVKKTDAAKATAKPSPRAQTSSAPKTPVSKTGTAGGQSSASRRSVPPAKQNTTAPKTTVGSAPSANASKPGSGTKPQTNGVSRPTSATNRPTTRPTTSRATTANPAPKTPAARPQTAKPSSTTPKTTPTSRPATAGTSKTTTTPTTRTPLSTRTTPLTRPSPVPSTLRPRPTSTSRLRAASATRKAQAAAQNGTVKSSPASTKTATSRTPLSRPSPKAATPSAASTKTPSKPAPATARTTSKPAPTRQPTTRTTPTLKKTTPTTRTPTKPGTKAPAAKGSTKAAAIKKSSTENAEKEITNLGKSEVSVEENVLIQHEVSEVNGLSNGVHPITNGVNGVHSDEEGQSLEIDGCNGALDCTNPIL